MFFFVVTKKMYLSYILEYTIFLQTILLGFYDDCEHKSIFQ